MYQSRVNPIERKHLDLVQNTSRKVRLIPVIIFHPTLYIPSALHCSFESGSLQIVPTPQLPSLSCQSENVNHNSWRSLLVYSSLHVNDGRLVACVASTQSFTCSTRQMAIAGLSSAACLSIFRGGHWATANRVGCGGCQLAPQRPSMLPPRLADLTTV